MSKETEKPIIWSQGCWETLMGECECGLKNPPERSLNFETPLWLVRLAASMLFDSAVDSRRELKA